MVGEREVKKRKKLRWPKVSTKDSTIVEDEVVISDTTFWRAKLTDSACLLWTEWKEEWEQPVFPSDAKYHAVTVYGRDLNQPRKTACYDRPYGYSGKIHPIEDVTPPAITKLYDVVQNIFGDDQKPNMCLANAYYHGAHYISDHSDDETAMGPFHNVYCFSVGATRKLRIKRKSTKKTVIELDLPAGFYVMCGEDFQKLFTHGFPKTSFTIPNLPKELEGANDIAKADWALNHLSQIASTLSAAKAKKFREWTQARFSYTLRKFEEQEQI